MPSTTPLRRKTIIGWMLACIAVTGLLGYEWIPEHLRGGWVLYLLLIACGAFLRVGQALVLGLLAFLATAGFLFYRANMGLPIQEQALMLLLNPSAPLWLSAIYHNLDLRRGASALLWQLQQRRQSATLNLTAGEHFERQLDALCRRAGLAGYRVIDVEVENRDLIVDMLGEQIWQGTRLRMLTVLEAHAGDGFFVFSDDELTRLRCFEVGGTPQQQDEPPFVQQLRAIRELILQVRIEARMPLAWPEPQP